MTTIDLKIFFHANKLQNMTKQYAMPFSKSYFVYSLKDFTQWKLKIVYVQKYEFINNLI